MRLLGDGVVAFRTMIDLIDLIDRARRCVRFENFIFADVVPDKSRSLRPPHDDLSRLVEADDRRRRLRARLVLKDLEHALLLVESV